MGRMLGSSQAEMHVCCEDVFAAGLLRAVLPTDIRERIHVLPIGSKSEFVKLANAHRLGGHPQNVLLIWDGDTSDSDIRRQFKTHPELTAWDEFRRVGWARLPGDAPPERWALDVIERAGTQHLAAQVGCSQEAIHEHLQACRAVEVHAIPAELGRRVGLAEEEAAGALGRAVGLCAEDSEVARLCDEVRRALEAPADTRAVSLELDAPAESPVNSIETPASETVAGL
jgi:hypothetical protein